jgi:hypothetical protein
VPADFKLSPDLELKRIIPLPQAAKISSLSVDSLKRHHADLLVQLSPRREGMRVGDALMLNRKLNP